MGFDPIVLSELQNSLRLDKVTLPHFEPSTSIGVNTYVTVLNVSGKRGNLAGFIFTQVNTSQRVVDGVRITVDGQVQDSPGLYNSSLGPFPNSALGQRARFVPLPARFKSSLLLEVKGNSQTGNFGIAAIWNEEI